jgi:hypothetical protein
VAPKTTTVQGTAVLPKAVATSVASVSNVATVVTSLGAGELKMRTEMKMPDVAPSSVAKGKQLKLDAGPPSTSIVTLKVSVQS